MNDTTPAWGTADSASGPLADSLIVAERSRGDLRHRYDVTTPDGTPVGTIEEDSQPARWLFGGAVDSRYELRDAQGLVLARMTRPGSFTRSTFTVTDAAGADVGTIEQENYLFSPQFRLSPAGGRALRLVGGEFGLRYPYEVRAADDTVLGRMAPAPRGLGQLLAQKRVSEVELSPTLAGGERLLVVLAAVCMDVVRDRKRG